MCLLIFGWHKYWFKRLLARGAVETITIRIFLCRQISTGVSRKERLTQSLICKYVGSYGIRSRANEGGPDGGVA